ncbi:hypothetical protein A2U01_0038081, partial [Trifolium medium]|nr:hypothetical protein [Trifolium medium]
PSWAGEFSQCPCGQSQTLEREIVYSKWSILGFCSRLSYLWDVRQAMDNRDSKKVVADGSESRRGRKRAEVLKPAPARSQKGKEAKVMFPSSDTSDTSSSDESADFIGAIEEFLRARQSPHLYPPGPASGEGGSQVGKEAKIWPEEVLWT